MNAHTATLSSPSWTGPSPTAHAGLMRCSTPVSVRVLEDLQADCERQSGHLSWDDVHHIVLGRSLCPADAVVVWGEASERYRLATEIPDAKAFGELLSPSEERILTRRVAAARLAAEAARQGILDSATKTVCVMGKEAFDRLIVTNTGLVGSIAANFAEKTNRLDIEDLFQEGILGLIRAIEKFDPDKGYKLSTYATWWIKQRLQLAISTTARTIRLPTRILDSLRQLKKKRSMLRHRIGRLPTSGELAHELGYKVGEVNLLLQVERDADLLEDIPREKGPETLPSGRKTFRTSSSLTEAEQAELSNLLLEQLKCLPHRSQFVILQRFGLEGRATHTLEQIGEKFQITRERVRQIEAKSLRRLARGEQGRALLDYFGG